MHEWALAQAVVLAAKDRAKEQGIKELKGVEVLIGELQTIDREVFSFALDNIKAEIGAESAVFSLISEPAKMRCRVCQNEFLFCDLTEEMTEDEIEMIHFLPDISKAFMKCPSCDSPDYDITQGRGVSLGRVS